MPKIYLVRHGEAAAGFSSHTDPGLSERGRAEAEVAAQILAPLPGIRLYSSPLRRAQETAAPLAALTGASISLEPRLAEIPSPTSDLEERARWLGGVMSGSWTDLPAALQDFRRGIIDCLCEQPGDAVFFSHFVAINLAVGAAMDDARMVVFRPANASITQLETTPEGLQVLQLGDEAQTRVN